MHRILLAMPVLLTALLGCGDRARETGALPPEGYAVLAEARGDLDGDGRSDRVRLVGRGAADSPFRDGFALMIGSAADPWPLPAAASCGYGPVLQLVDVTGDTTREILVVADTGGSGGMVAAVLLSARSDAGRWELQTIFDSESGPLPAIGGAFMPGFTATLKVAAPGRAEHHEHLDLETRREAYLKAGVYLDDGTLSRGVEIWGGGLMALTPVAVPNGEPALQLIQQARGTSNADRLAEIMTHLTWHDGRWRTSSLEVTPLN